jgi:hypothetical protein
VVSSTPIFRLFALSLRQCGSAVHVAPLPFHFNSFVSPLHPLFPGRCCHPRITTHRYPNRQGCPKKWSASAQLYNHCSGLLYCTRSSRTDNVACLSCLCAILQSGTGSRPSFPFSNRGTRRMNPQPFVDQRPQIVGYPVSSTASRKSLSRLSSAENGSLLAVRTSR